MHPKVLHIMCSMAISGSREW